jgi:hypothetical protein
MDRARRHYLSERSYWHSVQTARLLGSDHKIIGASRLTFVVRNNPTRANSLFVHVWYKPAPFHDMAPKAVSWFVPRFSFIHVLAVCLALILI